eukprot:GEMP01025299.1.p1 GENE.GEMP01025299.1~~GEMP01025299.1.p1  ORF type:complete len:382 (+),score=63.06 GEMP01025299.1:172-1317(+)
MRVAIIGGGAAGLCALRHAPKEAHVTLFEKRRPGGLWNRPSPIYSSLHTNIPTLLMAFPDFQFPKGEKSFPHHTVVKKYLEAYADNFQLHDRIQCREGHFAAISYEPMRFKGKQIHSCDFDRQDEFSGQDVVVLGAGASGTDIALLLAPVAKSVRWVHHGFAETKKNVGPNKIEMLPSIQMDEDGVTEDGRRCDVVIHATGFRFEFPFLSEELRPTDEGRNVPQDKIIYGMFSSAAKNLVFMGLQHQTAPFALFHYQAQATWKKLANWDLTCYDTAPQFNFQKLGSDTFLYAQALLELDTLPSSMMWRRAVYSFGAMLRSTFYDFRHHTIEFAAGEENETASAVLCDGIPLAEFFDKNQAKELPSTMSFPERPEMKQQRGG